MGLRAQEHDGIGDRGGMHADVTDKKANEDVDVHDQAKAEPWNWKDMAAPSVVATWYVLWKNSSLSVAGLGSGR